MFLSISLFWCFGSRKRWKSDQPVISWEEIEATARHSSTDQLGVAPALLATIDPKAFAKRAMRTVGHLR
jgi:hypothetical protein